MLFYHNSTTNDEAPFIHSRRTLYHKGKSTMKDMKAISLLTETSASVRIYTEQHWQHCSWEYWLLIWLGTRLLEQALKMRKVYLGMWGDKNFVISAKYYIPALLRVLWHKKWCFLFKTNTGWTVGWDLVLSSAALTSKSILTRRKRQLQLCVWA